jgi:[protein-PII] uridylyltransferase
MTPRGMRGQGRVPPAPAAAPTAVSPASRLESSERRALARVSSLSAEARSAFRAALKGAHERLRDDYYAGTSADELVAARARLIDEILAEAWRASGLNNRRVALLAVGGYGRGELHPASDVDVSVVVADGRSLKAASPRLEPLVTFLWDIGLEVGLSVRTVRECASESSKDLSVITNLTEARHLSGDPNLISLMNAAISPERIWPAEAFLAAKQAEQQQRHHRHHDTAQNLEPNLKDGPGGLRDIHTIAWVAKRAFAVRSLQALAESGFLLPAELQELLGAQSFLWRCRWALHTITGRREDRLLFDHQRAVAAEFGHANAERTHGIEQFMKLYYRTAITVSRLNELLMGLLKERLHARSRISPVTPINRRFQSRDGMLEAVQSSVFQRTPFALLEPFLILQQNPELRGVAPETIRLIREQRLRIDHKLRNDLRARSLFMEIMRQPRRLGEELERMHRYGVLEHYLPVFGQVVGMMQFDLFHVYTVDEHTLRVVRNLSRFWAPESPADSLPLCSAVAASIPKPELLFIAGLFHDIAKGRGGDHSELGEIEVIDFAAHHDLSPYDSRLVAWLVRNHLALSRTAQRSDISDPEVIARFATFVGDREHLNYLYLLTVADIRGTNPGVWNGWKDALLAELYRSTLRALRAGLETPLDKAERLAETRDEARALLTGSGLSRRRLDALWEDFGEDYLFRHRPDEIAWHTQNVALATADSLPLVLVRRRTARGGSEVFVYTRSSDLVFLLTTAVLEALNINILDARIIRSASGHTLHTYIVLDANKGTVLESEEHAAEVTQRLRETLVDPTLNPRPPSRRPSRQLKHFNHPTKVTFRQDPRNERSIMEVTGTDRPGFLFRVALAMHLCGVRLQTAKVATFGERVEDMFFITDLDNRPIEHPLKFECLQKTVLETLGQHVLMGV